MTSLQPAPPRHRHRIAPMRIALLGITTDDEAVTAAEVGRRLGEHGHRVTVYDLPRDVDGAPAPHPGVRLVTPAALGSGTPHPASRAALSAAHLALSRRHDVAVVLSTPRASTVPLIQARGAAAAVHMPDGDQHGRRTAGGRLAERIAVRQADALVVRTRAAQDHYAAEFGVQTDLIPPGTTTLRHCPADLVEDLGLMPGLYHLAVAGPAGRLPLVVEGYRRSSALLPLVVVTAAHGHDERTLREAGGDARIRLLTAVRDPRMTDQLHAHALSCVDGGAGGPLLRAMGAGTAVVGWDCARNREVAGTAGLYFSTAAQLARTLEEVERYPFRFRDIGELMQERASERFGWDAVAERYESLAAKLARGYSTRGMSTGRRHTPHSA